MRTTSGKEIKTVLQLDAPARYAHLVKRAADEQVVWGLWNDGWALMATDEGTAVFPLWPSLEYANLCATGEWLGYEAAEIQVDDLVEKLLPQLEDDGVLVGIFPTPSDKGAVASSTDLSQALAGELAKYA